MLGILIRVSIVVLGTLVYLGIGLAIAGAG
jgi:hypothetical protein